MVLLHHTVPWWKSLGDKCLQDHLQKGKNTNHPLETSTAAPRWTKSWRNRFSNCGHSFTFHLYFNVSFPFLQNVNIQIYTNIAIYLSLRTLIEIALHLFNVFIFAALMLTACPEIRGAIWPQNLVLVQLTVSGSVCRHYTQVSVAFDGHYVHLNNSCSHLRGENFQSLHF